MFLSSSGDLKISSALLIGRSYQLTSFLMASCSFYIVLVLNVYEVLSTALFLKKKISKLSSDVTHSLSKDVSSCTCVEPRVICRSILRNIFSPLRLMEGVNWRKKNVFFWALPELPNPPPLTPIWATWSSFFGSRNSRFESQFRT